MPTLSIQGREYNYGPAEVIDFAEGIIGLPEFRSAVLLSIEEYGPFHWLAFTESSMPRFVVVNPDQLFPDYDPSAELGTSDRAIETWVIVKISSDWQKTTFNLRAPILIDRENRSGAQRVLTDSRYQFSEALPEA